MKSAFRTEIKGFFVATLILIVLFLFLPAPGQAAVTLTLTDDASIDLDRPDLNLGDANNLPVADHESYGFARFDLSTLPEGVVGLDIQKATLKLWVKALVTPGYLDFHLIEEDWNEHDVTATDSPYTEVFTEVSLEVKKEHIGHYIDVDVTDFVKDWVDDEVENNGIAMMPFDIDLVVASKEDGASSKPMVIVVSLTGAGGQCTTCPAGAQGLQGEVGPAGPQGPSGAAGPAGRQGLKGDTGPKGDRGAAGTQGSKGDKGDKGDTGLRGPQGAKGNTGQAGLQGYQVITKTYNNSLYRSGLLTYHAACPSGKLAVGGGGFTNSKKVSLAGSMPSQDGKSWSAYWVNTTSVNDSNSKYMVSVVCVNRPPLILKPIFPIMP